VSNVKNMFGMFRDSTFSYDLTNWKPLSLKIKKIIFEGCPAPVPYWAQAENAPQAVKSHLLKKELDFSIVDNGFKSNKMKI